MLACATAGVIGLLLSASSAPNVRTGATLPSRRGVLQLVPALAVSTASLGAVRPASAKIVTDEIKLLTVKAKQLRAGVSSSAGNRRLLPLDPTPGVNNYATLTDTVLRAKANVLVPLQKAMAAAAKEAKAEGKLAPELQQELSLQSSYMKGHILELDQALKEWKFDEYVSKTTGSVYKGGKVERELEEVCETADDFMTLAAGRKIDVRSGTQ